MAGDQFGSITIIQYKNDRTRQRLAYGFLDLEPRSCHLLTSDLVVGESGFSHYSTQNTYSLYTIEKKEAKPFRRQNSGNLSPLYMHKPSCPTWMYDQLGPSLVSPEYVQRLAHIDSLPGHQQYVGSYKGPLIPQITLLKSWPICVFTKPDTITSGYPHH